MIGINQLYRASKVGVADLDQVSIIIVSIIDSIVHYEHIRATGLHIARDHRIGQLCGAMYKPNLTQIVAVIGRRE